MGADKESAQHEKQREEDVQLIKLIREYSSRGDSPEAIARRLNQHLSLVTETLRIYPVLKKEQLDFLDIEPAIYSRFFKNVLHFKTMEKARESIERLSSLYVYFETVGDRGGQHQTMVLALAGMNKARWSGRMEISELFREWIARH